VIRWVLAAFVLATLNFIVALISAKKALRLGFPLSMAVLMLSAFGRILCLLCAVFLVSRKFPSALTLFAASLVGMFFVYLLMEIIVFYKAIRPKK
jgi:hypothetical protein